MTELAPGPCANPAATRKERQAAPARAIRTNWGNLMGGRGIWAVAGLKPNSNAANLYICRDPGRIRAEQQSTGPRNGPFLNRHCLERAGRPEQNSLSAGVDLLTTAVSFVHR